LKGARKIALRVKPLAEKVTFDADTFSVFLVDGRVLMVPLAYFPRLLNATLEKRDLLRLVAAVPDYTGTN
jgi:hypothetical protein